MIPVIGKMLHFASLFIGRGLRCTSWSHISSVGKIYLVVEIREVV